jgi:hypothetical protein
MSIYSDHTSGIDHTSEICPKSSHHFTGWLNRRSSSEKQYHFRVDTYVLIHYIIIIIIIIYYESPIVNGTRLEFNMTGTGMPLIII